jgi:hypothetical protein
MYFLCLGLCETYSWGDNTNFTLGHSTQQRKIYPEAIDTFRKEKINVFEVCGVDVDNMRQALPFENSRPAGEKILTPLMV